MAQLKRLIKTEGRNWKKIAQTMGRSVSSVKGAVSKFNPLSVRSYVYWTESEKEKLFELRQGHGTDWTIIAERLGRSKEACKN